MAARIRVYRAALRAAVSQDGHAAPRRSTRPSPHRSARKHAVNKPPTALNPMQLSGRGAAKAERLIAIAVDAAHPEAARGTTRHSNGGARQSAIIARRRRAPEAARGTRHSAAWRTSHEHQHRHEGGRVAASSATARTHSPRSKRPRSLAGSPRCCPRRWIEERAASAAPTSAGT